MMYRRIPRATHTRALIGTFGLAFVLALVVAGCAGEQPETADTAVPADTQGAMGGMEGMEGMSGMQGDMMGEMMGHMQMMRGAGPDSMQAMLPMHRQMVANMLAQMNREMRDMNMSADARWDGLVDSLRTDLTRMPEMGADELQVLMPAHQDRMMRLMEMHRTMMSDMDM